MKGRRLAATVAFAATIASSSALAVLSLTVTPQDCHTILVEWTDPDVPNLVVRLDRSTDGVAYTTIVSQTAPGQTSLLDTTVAESSTYWYTATELVGATTTTSSSTTSSTTTTTTIGDTTPPTRPLGLVATAVDCGSVALSWNASTDTGGSGLAGYNLYVWRGTSWGFVRQVMATSTGVSGLAAATTYYYAVTAVDGAGNESGRSDFATVTTPACGPTTTSTTATQPPTTTTTTTTTSTSSTTTSTAKPCGG